MHLTILHSYLLQGTGSNIYVANIAKNWKELNHAVTILCHDKNAKHLTFIDEYYDSDDVLPQNPPAPGTIRVIIPQIKGILPVFVYDNYEGYKAKTISSMSYQEINNFIEQSSNTLKKILPQGIDRLLVNHAILNPAIALKALEGTNIPYDIKIHGSAIEFCLVPMPELIEYAEKSLLYANKIIAGSVHIKERILEVFANFIPKYKLKEKIFIIPPGIDPSLFKISYNLKEDQNYLLQKIRNKLHSSQDGRSEKNIFLKNIPKNLSKVEIDNNLKKYGAKYNQRSIDKDILNKWDYFLETDFIIFFFGKFIPTKGVGEILALAPDLLKRNPNFRFIFTGFGSYREHIELFKFCLKTGDLPLAKKVAEAGDFITEVNIDKYFRTLSEKELKRIFISGPMDHEILPNLIPLTDLCLIPSKLAEAFGMVAAEAMASGVLPLCNNHSGMKDIINLLKKECPNLNPILNTNKNNYFNYLPDKIEQAAHVLYPENYKNQNNRLKLAEQLRYIALKNYSWSNISKKLLE